MECWGEVVLWLLDFILKHDFVVKDSSPSDFYDIFAKIELQDSFVEGPNWFQKFNDRVCIQS